MKLHASLTLFSATTLAAMADELIEYLPETRDTSVGGGEDTIRDIIHLCGAYADLMGTDDPSTIALVGRASAAIQAWLLG